MKQVVTTFTQALVRFNSVQATESYLNLTSFLTFKINISALAKGKFVKFVLVLKLFSRTIFSARIFQKELKYSKQFVEMKTKTWFSGASKKLNRKPIIR